MGTHLSFVRSSELDMWTLRQLAHLECAGNKKVKTFFRNHGVQGTIDYSSQIADRWRNELADYVQEIYPKKSLNEVPSPKVPSTVIQPSIVSTENKEEKLQEEEKSVPIVAKPIQSVISRSTFKVTNTETKHTFKKSKVEDNKSVSFKPVTFKAQTDEEEFFDPQPLKPLAKPKVEILPTPAPSHVQRKVVEKKAISSEDYEAQFIDERVNKARIAQFSGANAISSDMFFGREEPNKVEITSEKFKDEASRIGTLAIEKASKVSFI